MSNPINFSQIQGKKGKYPLRDAVNEYKRDVEARFEFYQLDAKSKKFYFDNLVKEGFTEAQALEIVKSSNI